MGGQAIQHMDPTTEDWPAQLMAGSVQNLWVMGNPDLLGAGLLGIVCSRQCPGDVIVKTYEAIRNVRDQGMATVGGFHSPLEKECLDLLLRGTAPVVICPARNLEKMRVPRQWMQAIEEGRAILVSPFPQDSNRTTAEHARQRNRLVSDLAKRLLVPFAAPGSHTETLSLERLAGGKDVLTLDRKGTRLVEAGAKVVDHYLSPMSEGDHG